MLSLLTSISKHLQPNNIISFYETWQNSTKLVPLYFIVVVPLKDPSQSSVQCYYKQKSSLIWFDLILFALIWLKMHSQMKYTVKWVQSSWCFSCSSLAWGHPLSPYFTFLFFNITTSLLSLIFCFLINNGYKEYIDTYPQLERTMARNYFYASSRASCLKPLKGEEEEKASWKQIDRNQVLSIHCNKTKHLMTSTYSGMMRKFPFLFYSFMLPNLHSKKENFIVLPCIVLLYFLLGRFC